MEAIKLDESLFPWTAKGPTATPPIEGYIQDGEYINTTKHFEVQYTDMKQLMSDLLANTRRKKKAESEE